MKIKIEYVPTIAKVSGPEKGQYSEILDNDILKSEINLAINRELSRLLSCYRYFNLTILLTSKMKK